MLVALSLGGDRVMSLWVGPGVDGAGNPVKTFQQTTIPALEARPCA